MVVMKEQMQRLEKGFGNEAPIRGGFSPLHMCYPFAI